MSAGDTGGGGRAPAGQAAQPTAGPAPPLLQPDRVQELGGEKPRSVELHHVAAVPQRELLLRGLWLHFSMVQVIGDPVTSESCYRHHVGEQRPPAEASLFRRTTP